MKGYKNLSLAQLMEIEITSVSRRPESLGDVPSAVQVISGEDIRRAGATRLPEALRLLSNLHVAKVDSRQWAITPRGFNNTLTNKLLVQLDGRTLYTPLFAGVFWDVQDTLLDDINQIEVISGPGATQWGSNAVSGVINVTTKSARDTQGGLIRGAAGTELQALAAARYGGRIAPGLFYRVYGKHTRQAGSVTANGDEVGDSWHTTQGGFRTDWERNSNDTFTFQGDMYQGRIGQTTGDIEVEGANLVGRWTRTLGPKSQLTIQSYYDYTHRVIPGSVTARLDTYDVDFQHRLPIGTQNDLVWGGAYRLLDDRVTNPPGLAFLPAKVVREWISGFVQDELSVLDDRLRLTAGLKVEHNPYTGAELQPNVRAAWKLHGRHLLWGAISRAVRTPSRIDREFFVPAVPPFAIAGGPAFRSEELLAYELGYRVEAASNLAISLATFVHDFDRLRSVEPAVAPGQPSILSNGLTGQSYGAELSADYRAAPWWRLRFGYTELRVRHTPTAGSRDVTSARTQALDPKRHALLHSQFNFRSNTALDLVTRYVGRIEDHSVPAYVELDARLSWRPVEALELALTGKNLLDRQHPEFGPALPTRREVERSVTGSFTWRF